jgi:hypothetical protein
MTDDRHRQGTGSQDAALVALLASTMAPHWRPLLIALLILLVTAGLNAGDRWTNRAGR